MTRSNENSSKRLLTVKKAAEEYELNPQTIYYWIRYRKFPFIRIGRKILIRPAILDGFLEDHTQVEANNGS